MAAGRELLIMLIAAMIMWTINWIATFTWAGVGALIQVLYRKHYRVLNIAMALILLECIYSILKMT